MEKNGLIWAEQKNYYSQALRRIYAFQHRDGSWGEDDSKMSLTAQAIQLLVSLGYNNDYPPLMKAIHWFDNNVPKGCPHWPSKIVVDIQTGKFESLKNAGYISDFIKELSHDLEKPEQKDSLNIFWDVLPTVIALMPYEERDKSIVIPHKKLIQKLESDFEVYGDPSGDNALIAVGNKPNHTGLVALYFSMISERKGFEAYKNKSDAMINWLYANRQKDDDDNDIYWLGSKSVTSYILIDLNRCLAKDDNRRASFERILHFLTPDSQGRVGTDKVTTFNTEMHKDPTYISILVLRALSDVLPNTSDEIETIKRMANEEDFIKDIHYKISAFISVYKRIIPFILCGFFFVVSIVLFFKGSTDNARLVLSIVLSVFFGMWFNDLRAKD